MDIFSMQVLFLNLFECFQIDTPPIIDKFNRGIIKGLVNEVIKKQTLKTNINVIKETIENHLPAGNKEPIVVAVTKTVDEKTMRDLHALGVKHFGENRPDVFLKKYEHLTDINEEIKWHFIGKLKMRKVKKIVYKINYL